MFWVTICVSSRWSFGVLKKKSSLLLPPAVTLIEESFVFLHNKTINHMNIIFTSFQTIDQATAVDTESEMLAKQFLQR